MSLLRCVLFCTIFVAILDTGLCDKPHYDLKDASDLFAEFRQKYNRHYASDNDLEAHYEAFVTSLLKINYLNSIQNSATYDINDFADMTPEEIKRHLGVLTDEHFQLSHHEAKLDENCKSSIYRNSFIGSLIASHRPQWLHVTRTFMPPKEANELITLIVTILTEIVFTICYSVVVTTA
ncbi:Viral cathepsin [Papilio machaon]|uniref:Viral cathepsin n=1 Tax=Papilio machaon TaxID=76193 RepID=A0A194QV18_PAPMA|nr:Viral cathepsin [Papilio machaon]